MAYQPKSYRKFVATAATATLVAGAVAPFASAADASKFTDVSKSYQDAVNFVVSKGANGKTETTFGTSENITRVDAAVLLVKVLGLDTEGAPASGFKDVPARAVKEVNALKAAGITSGKSETTFNSNAKITRGELAVWIQRGFALEGSAAVNFKDVNSNYYQAVSALVANKVTSGKTPTTFGTSHNATRGEYAIFLYKAFQASDAIAVSSVKAINATTVEVTYKEKVTVEDIAASKYTIDGLTVSNAAIKQTDSKTVVLTTAAQEAGKSYTVKNNGTTVGSFTGVSAVIPTGIKVTTPSVQGTIGKEVTVKAQVTVADGQPKAGIPVTFNIVNDNSNLNQKVEVVAYTDAEGVASYSYTRYYKANDSFTAYATDKSSVFASGKVYWAEGLTVTEVTTGNALANGSKKVYKVSSPEYAGKYVNVAFAENIGVTPDIAVRGVKVTDKSLGGDYPYQYTTGGNDYVQIKLDSNGNATFTLTGTNSKVTPIVYISDAFNGPTTEKPATSSAYVNMNKYSTTALQSTVALVAFEAIQSFAIKVESQGVAAAAKYLDDTNRGGRDYKATVTNKDGQLAPKGTTVYVVVPGEKLDKNKAVWLVDKADSTKTKKVVTGDVLIPLTTNAKGEVEFTLLGVENAFATPTVMQDNGSTPGKLDKNDLQTEGESVYFGKAVVEKATLTVLDKKGNEVKSVLGNGTDAAEFVYQSVDQNGKPYATGTTFITSFQVTAGFNDITTDKGVVTNGDTKTFDVLSNINGEAVLKVTSGKVSTAYVKASAAQTTLPVLDASVSFTDSLELPAKYTGVVSNIDTTKKTITFANYDAVSYATSTFKNINGVTLSPSEFEKLVSANKGSIKVTAVKNTDGVYSFEIVALNENVAVAVDVINNTLNVTEVEKALNDNKDAFKSKWDALNVDQKTAVATLVFSTRGQGYTEAGLKSVYETAYATEVTKAITTVAGLTSKAVAVDFTAALTALDAVPGLDIKEVSELSKTAPLAAAGSYQGLALIPVIDLVAGATQLANVDALQTFLDAQVATQKAAIGEAGVTAAVTAVNDASNGAAIKTAVLDNATHVAALKLDLTGLTTAQLTAIANELFANKGVAYANDITIRAEFNKALARVKDVTAPTLDSAKLNAAGTELTLTFSEAIALSDVIAAGASGTGGTIAISINDGKSTTKVTILNATLGDIAAATNTITVKLAGSEGITENVTIKAIALTKNGTEAVKVIDTALPTPIEFVGTGLNQKVTK